MLRNVGVIVVLAFVVGACGRSGEDDGRSTITAPTGVSTSAPPPAVPAATTVSTTGDRRSSGAGAGIQACADVVDASLESTGSGYRVSATVRSGDTGWEKYADSWVVRTTEGDVLGERVLAHPHETEQPFTRSLDDVAIPAGVEEVEIAARDSVNGFCGEVFVVRVGR